MNKRDTCPKCRRDIKYREGKYGPFIGCSGYPDCKWTTSIEEWDDCDHDPDVWAEEDFWASVSSSYYEIKKG